MGIILPRGEDREVIQLAPTGVAKATLVSASLSDGSVSRTINAATSLMRVYATVQDVYLKWGTTTVTSSNFDEICPADQVVDLPVARDSTGALFTAYRIIERTASASIVIIEK